MSKVINEAIAAYHAKTTPAAIASAIESAKDREGANIITAENICWSAGVALYEIIGKELDLGGM